MRGRRTFWSAVAISAVLGSRGTPAAVVSLPADVSIQGPGASSMATLTIDDATGVQAVDATVEYDAALVAPTSVTKTPLSAGCFLESNTPQVGRLTLTMACAEALAGSGALVTITWQGLAAGTSALEIASCSLNEDMLPCVPRHGAVTVLAPTATVTPTATATVTPTASPSTTPTASPTLSATPTPTATPSATPTATPSLIPSATATPTVSSTATPTTTPPSTATATASATPTPPLAGDCDGSRAVSVHELVSVVNGALGVPAAPCAAADVDRDGRTTIDEILQAVRCAARGC